MLPTVCTTAAAATLLPVEEKVTCEHVSDDATFQHNGFLRYFASRNN